MRVALLGGLGIATLVGALFAYNKTRKVQQIPRQQILQTAKKIRQKMYLTLVQISCFVKQNYRKIPADQLKQYILDDSSQFVKMMKQKLSEVFVKYNEEEFKENVQKYYQDDAQIQYHIKLYQQQLNKSLLGVTPEVKQEIITFLTPQKILKIVKQLLDAKLKRITSSFTQKITFQEMVIKLRAKKQQEKALRTEKLKQIGLVGKDEQLSEIFQFAVAKYLNMDVEFRIKYQEIVEEYVKKSNQHVDRFCSFPRATSKRQVVQTK